MALIRLGQVAAEMQCTEEYISDTYFNPDVSNVHARTGTYSVYTDHRAKFGIGFKENKSVVRAGVYLYSPVGGAGNTEADGLWNWPRFWC